MDASMWDERNLVDFCLQDMTSCYPQTSFSDPLEEKQSCKFK